MFCDSTGREMIEFWSIFYGRDFIADDFAGSDFFRRWVLIFVEVRGDFREIYFNNAKTSRAQIFVKGFTSFQKEIKFFSFVLKAPRKTYNVIIESMVMKFISWPSFRLALQQAITKA